MNNKRVEWIDISKGIGIILVIVGHCVYFGGVIHNWIFSFHMPLFFIMSGLFFRPRKFRTIVEKRIKSLIIPYIVFSLIGLLVTLIIPAWRNKYSLRGLIYDLYMSSPDYVNVSSIWFLMCLFIVTCLFDLIENIINNKSFRYVIVIFCAIMGFLFAEKHESIVFLPGKRLPFNIDVALVALLFFSIGYYNKDIIISSINSVSSSSLQIRIASIVLLVLFSGLLTNINGRVNLHGLTFNNPVLYIIDACVGSSLIMLISCLVNRLKKVSLFLQWVGKNSLIMLGVQAILVRLYIWIINALTNNYLKLYYLPIKHAIAGIFFVTGVSLIFTALFNCVKEKIEK